MEKAIYKFLTIMNRKKSKNTLSLLATLHSTSLYKDKNESENTPRWGAQFDEVRKMMIMKRDYSLLAIFGKC